MVERQKINSSEFRVLSSESGTPQTQNVEHGTQFEKLIIEVNELYEWLNSQIENNIPEKCEACGQCCDFVAYDHRLYVTILETIYLAAKLKVDNLKPMRNGICPYNKDGKCTVHLYRFAGCRIFNCKANSDIQSELSELVLKKLKALCEKYKIGYRYMDLNSSLNENSEAE